MTFGLWLCAGLLPWLAVVGGLVRSASSVVSQPTVVKNISIPLYYLSIVPIVSAFLESTLGLCVLIVFVWLFSHTLNWTLLLLPLVVLTQLIFTLGIGFFLASLTVFLKDIPLIFGLITTIWFFLTPIVYPAHLIPEPLRDWVFWLNPMATICELYRDIFFTGRITYGTQWVIALSISLIVFVSGYRFYRKTSPAFADVL